MRILEIVLGLMLTGGGLFWATYWWLGKQLVRRDSWAFILMVLSGLAIAAVGVWLIYLGVT